MELIVTSSSNKMNILKNNQTLKQQRFINIKNLKAKIFGKMKDEGVYFLYNKYNFSLPFIFNLNKYLAYLNIEKEYNSSKLNQLKSIKKELIENNYYEYDNLFINYLKTVKITFLNIDLNDDLILNYLNINNINYEIINKETKAKEYILYNAKDQKEEIAFIFMQINNLLNVGINPNNIHLVNVSNNYYNLLERMSYFYQVDIDIPASSTLISKNEVNEILDNVADLTAYIPNIKDPELANFIIDIVNKYNLTTITNVKFIKELLIYLLRNKSYKNKQYESAIKISDFNTDFKENDYVFLINFNQNFPTIPEENYLNNSELIELNIQTNKNQAILDKTISSLSNINNLVITIPKMYLNEQNFNSIIYDKLKFTNKQINLELGHNMLSDNLSLASDIDNYLNYNIKKPTLDLYDLKHLKYNSYDNKFKPFNVSLPDNVNLSYSSMKTYFSCAFHYYLDYVLKLSIKEDTLSTKLGTYVHQILQDSYNKDFDFNTLTNSLKEDMTEKEKFYASRFDEVLKRLLQFNYEYENNMELKDVKREEKIEIKNGFITLKGFIDKIRFLKQNNELYLAIYDYKTGSDEVSLDNISYGYNMQLPTYLYLLSNKYSDLEVNICGLYLQKVTLETLELDPLDCYKPFLLQGYTNLSLADKIDKNYANSSYIKGLKVNKDGSLYRYAKTIDLTEIEKIIEIVTQNLEIIKKTYSDNNWPINPKIIDNKDEACMYCPYANICYKKYNDKVKLEAKPFKEV